MMFRNPVISSVLRGSRIEKMSELKNRRFVINFSGLGGFKFSI